MLPEGPSPETGLLIYFLITKVTHDYCYGGMKVQQGERGKEEKRAHEYRGEREKEKASRTNKCEKANSPCHSPGVSAADTCK